MEKIKNKFRAAVLSIFDKGNDPMKNTLNYKGDPGLFGPDSVTWRIISDVASFIAGMRALMVQSAHPEVVDGFYAHSNLWKDPMGRMSRTGDYVAVTCFGSMPEVNRMIAMLKKMHEPVTGKSSRGIHYSANQPELLAWVHYALTQSFLKSYKLYGDAPLSQTDADLFVAEQQPLAKLLGIEIMLNTEKELDDWIHQHADLEQTDATLKIMDFLTNPPLNPSMIFGYRFVYDAATNMIDPRLQSVLGTSNKFMGHTKGAILVKCLRTALGFSPALKQAYDRIEAPYPDNRWFVDAELINK